MQQLLIALFTFISAILYVLLLSYLANSPYALQKSLVFPAIILFLFLYFSPSASWRKLLTSNSRWILLFLCTILIQLLILSTGGLKSPFFILLHLFMVGLGLLFSFSVALLFLLSSFFVLFINLALNNALLPLLTKEPTLTVLQLSSLISIVPVAYIVSQHYHFKDKMFKKLTSEFAANQAILESLNELIIITDLEYKILSVNDAVVKIMHKSKSQLLNTPIFDVLFIKNQEGKLITKDTFGFNSDNEGGYTNEYTLIRTSLPQQKIILHAQTIKDSDGKATQISFIISNKVQSSQQQSIDVDLKRARALYEAMAENLKKQLMKKDLPSLYTKLIILAKYENDIYQAHAIKEASFNKDLASIDIAELCKRNVVLKQDFSRAFHVPTDFAIRNFSRKDIAGLVSDNVEITPEQLTGPFFSAQCDAKYLEIIIEELIDLTILLATTQKQPQVIITVDRDKNDDILIEIAGRSPSIIEEQLPDMFVPYYGKLANTTNLHSGSGLEGYLAKTISDNLKIPLEVKANNAFSTISFTLRVPRKASV